MTIYNKIFQAEVYNKTKQTLNIKGFHLVSILVIQATTNTKISYKINSVIDFPPSRLWRALGTCQISMKGEENG